MFVQLPFWLFPLTGLMALGALIALGLVLWRGDLCPGQRSRITTQLFSVWVSTGLSLMLAVEAKAADWLIWSGAAALILGVVLSLAQSRLEGKRAIPATLFWLPAMPLLVYGIGLLQIQGWLGGLLQMVLLGAAFAHLMLLRARHRLQAFNTLLPLAGLVAAILSLLWLAVLVGWQGNDASLDALIPGVLTQAALLIAALLLWFSPLYRQQETAPVVVSTALCGLIIAQLAATSVLHQLA
ncbi:hypothetical protein [Aeromonas hydrophila]|uniref:Uncharacterized protein n=1 Tax=Aeromonas hydrophila subsp. hydrophila (strain ATCC 7966 / DSM 30187 / BCRC 13018 / CCUG 14551 / JCM 1027 / KCTC 2358 / NCIMB 9240 / NCTC 8049) TaxID=380703 RepID=A0KKW0_AERHH|nr:hypothetical protein [Aeromonas hydrophila]ABK38954.1 conserved hypothetical protein [Aeromonas hydrophila subsp. hydrophila ATCC 7966]MBS4671591.1 hypothetical protein [Aeromonas hydrophila]OOD33633.1 hypothetical protein BWP11_09675 [Aeromonas hydrophila]SUU28688.1 Uncharacterised protein [Aeromonas hydrophila]